MDVLSRILDGIEMRGSLYFPADLHAPWGLEVPADRNVCRFHVAVDGGCYLTAGGEPVRLSRGDLALVPHGREHRLQDHPATPLVDLEEALAKTEYAGEGTFRWGEDGTRCRLVCGHFEFDKEAAHPLLDALPAIVHIEATATYDFRWIDQVLRFIGEEMHAGRPGSGVIARRLSEVLFVQVIRHYAESSPEPVPVLAGITDPQLSRVLHAIHTELDRPWTLEQLAREGAMSRTSFALRFSEKIGTTPMKYLTDERMRAACRLLATGSSMGRIAARVGYASEAAFARRFKSYSGVSPGRYRRLRATGSA